MRVGGGPIQWVDLGPGVQGGFTVRGDGGSPTPWGGMNLGLSVGDDPARVHAHRARISALVGAPVVFATQVHGACVVDIDRWVPDGIERAVQTGTVGDGDAMVASVGGVGLGVLVADCVPVLLADASAGVVAVAHAGRRGLQGGVIGAVVEAMRVKGADPGRMRAVIGPSICGQCYEVPSTMRAQVAAGHPLCWSTTRAGTAALDLAAGVAGELAQWGTRVRRQPECTLEDDTFFSHRASQSASGAIGRFAGIVRLVREG